LVLQYLRAHVLPAGLQRARCMRVGLLYVRQGLQGLRLLCHELPASSVHIQLLGPLARLLRVLWSWLMRGQWHVSLWPWLERGGVRSFGVSWCCLHPPPPLPRRRPPWTLVPCLRQGLECLTSHAHTPGGLVRICRRLLWTWHVQAGRHL